MSISGSRTSPTVFIAALLAIVAVFHSRPSVADPVVNDEFDLIGRSATPDKSKENFYQTSEDQFDKMRAAGILRKKLTSRFDYVSYYRPLKSAYFHGAKLLYFELEYLEQFIGCCVDDGFGLILQGTANRDVVKFAADNGCKINDGDQIYLPDDINKEFKSKGIKMASVFELSCRANDAQR